jgi:hydrogenase maturation protein HypF
VGDLDSAPAREFLSEVIDGLLDFLQLTPDVIAADAHPDYPSSWLADELASHHGAEVFPVQHHLAHAAAVLGEHDRWPEPGGRAYGIALDGTGWGPDGTAWGGEWIELDGDLSWRRLGHLEPLPLVGGESAVRQPWRVAVAALVRNGAGNLIEKIPLASMIENERCRTVMKLAAESSWPMASGAGRVFEAAGAMLGVGIENRWEGEAAARLESLAAPESDSVEPWTDISLVTGGPVPVLPSARLLTEVARRASSGEPPSRIAAGFHATFCHLAASLTTLVAGPDRGTVAIGGGCAINRLLSSGLADQLEKSGFEALLPSRMPPGDGGLSYGQAVIAAVAKARGVKPVQIEMGTSER